MPSIFDRLRTLPQRAQARTSGPLLGKVSDAMAPAAAVAPGRKRAPFCAAGGRPCVTVCKPTAGCDCQSEAVRAALVREIAALGLNLEVGTAKTGCGGQCNSGPFIGFPQQQLFYVRVQPGDAADIARETLLQGKILFPLLSVSPNRSYRADILFERETGMLAAIDDSVCMVEVAKYFLEWEAGLSCGKCVPCRLGMQRLNECMERIVGGSGTLEDLEQIKLLCHTMINASHCEFAMTSSRPVLSAVTYFENEFLAHIERQECAAGVCEKLVAIQKKKATRELLKSRKKKKKK